MEDSVVKIKTALSDSSTGIIDVCSHDGIGSCKICLKENAKYTCPRCNVGYCSLSCYQSEKHATCSEAFYKDCVLDELKDMKAPSQDQEKVLKMLTEDLEQRAEDESEEEQEEDLGDRLRGVDIDKDTQVVWSRLTQKEKEDFARMLQDGRLARLIEIWTPWWRCKENYKLVKEHGNVSSQTQQKRSMPDILVDIPDINTLLKNTHPSMDCRFDLINILYGYCFVSRVHNGCHLECPVDSAQYLLQICAVLRENYRCGSAGEAVQKALDDVCKSSKGTESFSQSFCLTVLEDVKIIISGPGQVHSMIFIAAALSDLTVLLRSAHMTVKQELKSRSHSEIKDLAELKTLKSQVFKGEKKIIFLLSWLQHYGNSVQQIIPLLQFEIETRQSEVEDVEDIKSLVESNMERLKPLNVDLNTETISPKIIELD